jgi:hypothetical protein
MARIKLIDRDASISLTADEKKIADHVIEQTRRLSWDPFIRLVYSTYPILTGTRGDDLDLVRAARDYKESMREMAVA